MPSSLRSSPAASLDSVLGGAECAIVPGTIGSRPRLGRLLLVITPNGCIFDFVVYRVVLSKLAKKQLSRLPAHIGDSLLTWVDDVEERGLESVRRVPGYHDEPSRAIGRQNARSGSIVPGERFRSFVNKRFW